jgi:acyl-CoA thioesterase-1
MFVLRRCCGVFAAAFFWISAAAQAEEPLEILAVGDSLTAGYGLAQEQAFPRVLERRLSEMGWTLRVRNGGVSGDTTAGGRARLAWMLEPRPDAAILELGANDALRGLPPAAARANLAAMLAELRARRIPVLLAGMLAPPNLGAAYAREFDAIHPSLAKEFGVPLYPFFLDGAAGNPALLQADGLHPNPKGVEEIVRRILPDAARLAEAARAAKAAR